MGETRISLADVKDTKGYFAKVREGVDYLKQCGETTCTSPNNIRKLIISPSFMAAAYYVDSPVHKVDFDMTQEQLIDFLCNGSNTNDFLSLFVKTPVCDNIEEILYCYPTLLSGCRGKIDDYFPDHSYDASATINHFKRLYHFVYVESGEDLDSATKLAKGLAIHLSNKDNHEENYIAFDESVLKNYKHEFKKENPDYLYNKGLTPVSISTYSLEDKNGGALFVRMNRLVQIALVARAKKTKETQEAQEDKSKPSVTETILKPALAYAINLRNTIFISKIGTTVEDKVYKFDMTESANEDGTYDEFLFTDSSYSEIIHDYDEMSVKIRKLTEGYNNGGSLCIFSSSYDFSDEAIAYDLFTTWFAKAGGNGSNFFQMLNYFCSCLTVVSLMTELDNGDGTYDLVVETAYAKLKGSKFFKGQANNPIKLEGKYDNKFDEDAGDFKGFVATRYCDTINPEDVEEEEEEFPEESEYTEENQYPDDEEFDENNYIEEDTVPDEDYDSEEEYDEDDYIDEDTDDGSDAFDNSENEDDVDAFIDEDVDTQEETTEEPTENPVEEVDEKEEQYKQELKKGDISGKIEDKEIPQADIELDERLSSVVDNIIDNILGVYSAVYQPLFTNPPVGVFYTNNGKGDILALGRSGDPTDKEGVKVHGIPSLSFFCNRVYSAVLSACKYIREAPAYGIADMQASKQWISYNGTMKYNYAPHIQIRNCMGVYRDKETKKLKRAKNWKEFESKLKEDLKPTILAFLKCVNYNDDNVLYNASTSITEFYTTIFLVDEFDPKKNMRFTVYSMAGSNSGALAKIADSVIQANPLNKTLDKYSIMNNSEKNGIRTILIITDMQRYKGEINFAYKTLGKIVKSGGKLNLKNTVVGTDMVGNTVTINLADASYTAVCVIAGSGSGKGVLTMTLVASMLASKCPVIYLDFKPDMAAVFWEFDRELGTHTLAIDGQTSIKDGLRPVRAYKAGYGANSEVFEQTSSYMNLLPYIKGVQLMNVMGSLRKDGKLPSKSKAFFILDEAQQCGSQIKTAQEELKKLESQLKPKGKQPESDAHKYVVKLCSTFFSIKQAMMDFVNTNGRSGNMTAVLLGQQANGQEWTGPFSVAAKNCAAKFVGKGSEGGGSKFGLDKTTQGIDLIDRGYFGFARSSTPTAKNTTIVKTALVLNKADYNAQTGEAGAFTGDLLNNIADDRIRQLTIDEDFIVSESNDIALSSGLQVGQTNDLVGFPGLIRYLGSMTPDFDLKSSLNAGYDIAETVLHMLGIVGEGCPYENVESYLYSGREDSLFKTGQLLNAANQGMTIYDFLEKGVDTSGDGRIFEDSDDDGAEKAGNSGNSNAYNPNDAIGVGAGTFGAINNDSSNSTKPEPTKSQQQTNQTVPKKAAPNMTVSNKVISLYAKQLVLNKVKTGVKLPKPKEVLMRALYDATKKALVSQGYKIVK